MTKGTILQILPSLTSGGIERGVIEVNNYLVKKRQEAVSNQNTNVRRKTLATDIGRSFVNDDNAYVKVLFIPTLITFTYLLSLFLYCFVFK